MTLRAGSLTLAVMLAILTTSSAWGICESGGASQPTVGITYTGPDENGNVTATVSYGFPNTDSYLARLIDVYRDGVNWNSHRPEDISGTKEFVIPFACFTTGSHSLFVAARACGNSST